MKIPDFTLPPLIGKITQKLPQWPADQLLIIGLNMAVKQDIIPRDMLEHLQGRTIGFEVIDLQFSTAVTCLGERFWRAEVDSAELMMRANAAQFLQLLNRQEDPDTLFFNRTLIIEGDTELGLIVKNMLDSIDWSTLSDHPVVQWFQKKVSV